MADPGAEIDLLAMVGRLDLIRDYIAFLRLRFQTIVTSVHHSGVTLPLLESEGIDVDGYLTTVNCPGIFMFPTPELALDAISQVDKPVIAIKPMAGGRYLGPKAFDFVFNQANVAASMYGRQPQRPDTYLGQRDNTKTPVSAAVYQDAIKGLSPRPNAAGANIGPIAPHPNVFALQHFKCIVATTKKSPSLREDCPI